MKQTSFKFMTRYRYIKYSIFLVVALAIFGTTLMLLWNWLIPSIFGLTTLNFWQAIGLFALARLLFSGIGFRRGHGSFGYDNFGIHATDQERKKWMEMSFNERQEWFKKRGFYRGFGFHSQHGSDSVTNKEENHTPKNE